jgi:hypothetical protein
MGSMFFHFDKEPHQLVRWPPAFLSRLWWRLRGVGVADYRALCSRCQRTGQAHWGVRGCRRFSRAS